MTPSAFGERKVLDDVSLQINPGEAFCTLGRSGTGKSVTLKLMIGLLQPDQGGVYIEGSKLQDLDTN
ncbi:MAG TPA: ATP-binding cassette domain-containing protein [Terriglobales bacterium]|nr:ATP-binding cassette domain-containing protein [Terriglobales bacterium]